MPQSVTPRLLSSCAKLLDEKAVCVTEQAWIQQGPITCRHRIKNSMTIHATAHAEPHQHNDYMHASRYTHSFDDQSLHLMVHPFYRSIHQPFYQPAQVARDMHDSALNMVGTVPIHQVLHQWVEGKQSLLPMLLQVQVAAECRRQQRMASLVATQTQSPNFKLAVLVILSADSSLVTDLSKVQPYHRLILLPEQGLHETTLGYSNLKTTATCSPQPQT